MDWKTFLILEKALRWMRGFSVMQLSACDKLLHALRDDIEQESTYRVRDCLQQLGLSPLITSRQIKHIMGLSQYNDLAFLWFTWEAFYKQPHECFESEPRYSNNEQLLLTAIAHLDMMTTMRALDDLLPKPEFSKKYIDMQKARQLKQEQQALQAKEEQRKRRQERANMYRDIEAQGSEGLPYLMPQRRPKPYAAKNLITARQPKKIVFSRYEKYKNRLFRIPNENSRWFATYELSPVKREIKRCLSEIMLPLFGQKELSPEKPQCNVHRMMEHSMQIRRQELLVKTMRRHIELLNSEASQMKRTRAHIKRQLEEDVACATYQLHEYARAQLKKLKLIVGESCTGGNNCEMCQKMVVLARNYQKPTADFSFVLDQYFHLNDPSCCGLDEPVRVYELGAHRKYKLIHVEKNLAESNAGGLSAYCRSRTGCPPKDGLIAVLNDRGQILELLREEEHEKEQLPQLGLLKIYDERGNVSELVHSSDSEPQSKSSDTSQYNYFSRKTMVNGIPQWDYFKVYEVPSQASCMANSLLSDVQPLIKGFCVSALKRPMQRFELPRHRGGQSFLMWMNEESPRRKVRPVGYLRPNATVDAAEKCALDMSKKAAKDWDYNNSSSDSSDEKHTTCYHVTENQLQKVTNINPDNWKEVTELLRMGMDIMRQDPQYVLVTLPNAHMIPVLTDWVAERYGRSYDSEELCQISDRSRLICDRLLQTGRINAKVMLPPLKDTEHMTYSEWVCRNEQLDAEYSRKLNENALEDSRLIWLAVNGYSNLCGNLVRTLFAYLPNKTGDLKRQFTWTSSNFRNMAVIRSLRAKNMLKQP
ncbi:hypothetical protein KR222_000492 [Zaprionus bogoriensis]|nr:hypothetical protein KR222_000492 [Zaprionus bogoriensis]